VISTGEFIEKLASVSIEAALGLTPSRDIYRGLLPTRVKDETMYRVSDAFELKFIYFTLPRSSGKSLILVGPYVTAKPSEEWLLTKLEELGISPTKLKPTNEYFSTIPVITRENHIFDMLDTFCERIWQTDAFAIVDIKPAEREREKFNAEEIKETDFDETSINMRSMERRYAFENELIDAVSRGQIQMENRLIGAFSEETFQIRVTDRLRNAKNYAIIMNTLLRKAAERGGVHPVHIDKLSSELALEIEGMSSLGENREFMIHIFRSYCKLVREHSTSHLSPIVQKTVILIEADLSANLTLSSLAEAQNVSSGYLSAVFKKETGKTLSEFIRDRRIAHAQNLLRSTNLQIQTIALHCGIIDVQYFTETFKKVVGITPREYREKAL
jgi:AraC-like DNA-binding protein